MKSLVIVADSSFVIETIRLSLKASAAFELIGKLDGRAPVGAAVGHARPDVVLIDEMQNGDRALERIRECRDQAPSATVLLFTAQMDDARVARALTTGADACISKSAHLPSLGTMIREIANRNVVSALAPAPGSFALRSDEELTAREREILGLATHGLTNARIGKQLWVTEQTVKFHLSNIYRKLGVSNRTEASAWAHARGLTRPAEPRLASVHELSAVPTANVA